jgi:hypothetical protein
MTPANLQLAYGTPHNTPVKIDLLC